MNYRKKGLRMKNNFDFENAIKQVKSKRIQKYLEEVISTYNNCEYRSCIVMLYATTFADALDKIRTMSEVYQNEKAEKFLEKYNKGRNDNRSYSALKREVKEFIVNSGLINDIEEKQWEHLKDYRDYCAHPVVERDYGLISPNEEQVRMHIRNMFEALFLKDAILTDNKVFEEFLIRIEDFYDRNQLDGLDEYVNTRYIRKLDLNTKGKFLKNLWKFSFYIDGDEECDKYRKVAYRVIIWIIQSDRNNTLKFIEENINYFNGKIRYQDVILEKSSYAIKFYENRTLALVYLLYRIPEIYRMLSEDNQTEIKSVVKKNINLILMAPYLYENSQEHVKQIIKNLKDCNYCLYPYFVNELREEGYKIFDYEYNELVIYYFYNCQNSDQWSPDFNLINKTYREVVSDAIPFFTLKQMDSFLKQLPWSYEQASCMGKMVGQIMDVIEKKGYEIDFSKYNVNITNLQCYNVCSTIDE